jgi:hypothetical protein
VKYALMVFSLAIMLGQSSLAWAGPHWQRVCDNQNFCYYIWADPEVAMPKHYVTPLLITETRRAAMMGNPPKKPMLMPQVSPITLSRPPEIPKSYPLSRNNGTRFY